MRVKRFFIILAVVLTAAIGSTGFWLIERDPLLSLPEPEHELSAERAAPVRGNGRRIEHVTLRSDTLGEIGFTLSLPDPLPARRLPIVLVLGGLGTGENNIRSITEAGDNAIIGYDWPMPVRFYDGIAVLTQLPGLYRRLMAIPAQVTSAIFWLSAEPWADRQRISLLGFSLGAMATPAIEDMAEQHGQAIGWTILAYGGAPFGALVDANPHVKPGWLRPVLAALVDRLLDPLQPTRHLAHLSGQFLVLEGSDDTLIPAPARKTLRDAVPAPKTLIRLEGDHMGVGGDKLALLLEIMAASRNWLAEHGAIEPIGRDP